MNKNNSKSLTQRFVESYIKVDPNYNENYSRQALYPIVTEFLKQELAAKRSKQGYTKLSTAFKQTQHNQNKEININISDICK